MPQAPDGSALPSSPPIKPPANPTFVRLMDFLLALVILALAPFFEASLSSSGSSDSGLGFYFVLIFHLPALIILWLVTLIWSRFRWIPLLDRWLPTVAVVTLGSIFMRFFGAFAVISAGLLALCALVAFAAIFFDFGRFERPGTRTAPSGAAPAPRPIGGEAAQSVQRAVPVAYPAPRSRTRVALKILLVGLAVTVVQTLFAASPVALVVQRFAESLGLSEPMMAIRQDWFGVVMLVLVVLVVEGFSIKDSVRNLGLANPRSALIPIAVLIVPALPVAYFGIQKTSAPYVSWPPDLPTLLFLLAETLFLEGFYRGYFLGGLTRRASWPWVPAVIISALLAAAPELEGAFSVDPYWPAIWQMVAIELAFSLFACLLFVANRGNLYPCLVYRLISPFILVAVFQGSTTARVILGVWAVLVLCVSALVARQSGRQPARRMVAPAARSSQV